MIRSASKLKATRRQFLLNALPTGALFCLGCRDLLALPPAKSTLIALGEKHKFEEDSGMTVEQVVQFAYQGSIPVLQIMAEEIGREKFIEMLKNASHEYHYNMMKEMTKDLPKKDIAALADFTIQMVTSPPYDKMVIFEVTEKTDKVLEVTYKECIFAKTLRAVNAADLGLALQCESTFAFAEAFNPKIKASHPKTLMEGADVCIERFVWEG